MSLKSLLVDDLSLLRRAAGAPDRLGNPTEGYAAPIAIKGRLEQTTSQEIAVGQDVVVSNWRAYLFPDVEVGPLDRIEDTSGRIFEVVGQPDLLKTPRGPHHIEVNLRTVLNG